MLDCYMELCNCFDKTLDIVPGAGSFLLMLQYPQWLKPDLLQIGNFKIRWYGIMYLLGFLIGRIIARHLCKTRYLKLKPDSVDDLLLFLFFGMLVGARVIYMLVYYVPTEDDPFTWLTPFAIWQGGLAFHGAVLGMFLACKGGLIGRKLLKQTNGLHAARCHGFCAAS